MKFKIRENKSVDEVELYLSLDEDGDVTVYGRSLGSANDFPIVTFFQDGELLRRSGIPSGLGFRTDKDDKIVIYNPGDK